MAGQENVINWEKIPDQELLGYIVGKFETVSKFKGLLFSLAIDGLTYDVLAGDSILDKARELVQMSSRHGFDTQLRDAVRDFEPGTGGGEELREGDEVDIEKVDTHGVPAVCGRCGVEMGRSGALEISTGNGLACAYCHSRIENATYEVKTPKRTWPALQQPETLPQEVEMTEKEAERLLKEMIQTVNTDGVIYDALEGNFRSVRIGNTYDRVSILVLEDSSINNVYDTATIIYPRGVEFNIGTAHGKVTKIEKSWVELYEMVIGKKTSSVPEAKQRDERVDNNLTFNQGGQTVGRQMREGGESINLAEYELRAAEADVTAAKRNLQAAQKVVDEGQFSGQYAERSRDRANQNLGYAERDLRMAELVLERLRSGSHADYHAGYPAEQIIETRFKDGKIKYDVYCPVGGDFLKRPGAVYRFHNDQVKGEVLEGDEIQGDMVGGDVITYGNISPGASVAIGRGARASTTSHSENGMNITTETTTNQDGISTIKITTEGDGYKEVVTIQEDKFGQEINRSTVVVSSGDVVGSSIGGGTVNARNIVGRNLNLGGKFGGAIVNRGSDLENVKQTTGGGPRGGGWLGDISDQLGEGRKKRARARGEVVVDTHPDLPDFYRNRLEEKMEPEGNVVIEEDSAVIDGKVFNDLTIKGENVRLRNVAVLGTLTVEKPLHRMSREIWTFGKEVCIGQGIVDIAEKTGFHPPVAVNFMDGLHPTIVGPKKDMYTDARGYGTDYASRGFGKEVGLHGVVDGSSLTLRIHGVNALQLFGEDFSDFQDFLKILGI